MRTLIRITEETLEDKKSSESTQYKVRESARAVLFSKTKEVYLLKVTTKGYHKLPGGGINKGEKVKSALRREIYEEVGCKSKISKEIGEIVEYFQHEEKNIKQHSFCYIAKQIGGLNSQRLEQSEIDEGHNLVIAKSIDEAIKILENDRPKNIEGEYIKLRDITILEEAKKILATV